MGANKLAANAKAANASKGAQNLSASGMAPETSNFLTTAPVQTTSSVGVGSGNMLAGVPSTMSSFSALNGASAAPIPAAQSTQAATGLGDAAYNSAVSAAPKVANQALTATLAPEATQPIAGTMDSFGQATDAVDSGNTPYYVPGGAFDAFYQGNGNYDQASYDQGLQNLADNAYKQTNMMRDTFLPTGQTEIDPNTPYTDQMNDIYTSAGQGVQDYTKTFNEKAQAQADEANTYYNFNSFRAQNPSITDDQMRSYMQDPSLLPQGTPAEVVAMMPKFAAYNNPTMSLFK
jgi:hypothetical protein